MPDKMLFVCPCAQDLVLTLGAFPVGESSSVSQLSLFLVAPVGGDDRAQHSQRRGVPRQGACDTRAKRGPLQRRPRDQPRKWRGDIAAFERLRPRAIGGGVDDCGDGPAIWAATRVRPPDEQQPKTSLQVERGRFPKPGPPRRATDAQTLLQQQIPNDRLEHRAALVRQPGTLGEAFERMVAEADVVQQLVRHQARTRDWATAPWNHRYMAASVARVIRRRREHGPLHSSDCFHLLA